MFDLRHYWPIYTFALAIMLAPTPMIVHLAIQRLRARRKQSTSARSQPS